MNLIGIYKYLILLMLLTGCSGVIPEPGMPYAKPTLDSILNSHKPVKISPKNKRNDKIPPSVSALLGAGAGLTLASVGATLYADGSQDTNVIIFAGIVGGAGVVLLSSAGIVFLFTK